MPRLARRSSTDPPEAHDGMNDHVTVGKRGAMVLSVVLGVLGVAIVVAVIVDLLWTTLAAGAAGGPVTARVTHLLWRSALRWQRRRRLLQVAGVAITTTVILLWIALLLGGWFLVFSATPDAVVSATTGQPGDVWSRIYFTGYTVFTLGLGDYVPGAPLWRVATVPATATGLTVVTLAITYLLSVTESVTQRRKLAAQIFALGPSPSIILRRAWNGTGIEGLEQALQSLTSEVAELAQRHLAFPVLHYFHSVERDTAIAPSIAVLDELLTILDRGITEEHRLPTLTTEQLRDAITQLLHLGSAIDPAQLGQLSSPPPVPPTDELRRIGLPLVDDAQWRGHVEELADRRQALRDYLTVEAWGWDTVWPPDRT